ncbi:MAG: trimethylamine methyltransferase family protein [Haloarculaceae archaeon]
MKEYDTHTLDVPYVDRLDEEGLDAIHEGAMHIIENVGIKLNHERALDLYDEAGAEVDYDEHMVKVPRDIIEDGIDSVPSSFTLHGRGGQEITVGPGEDGQVRAPGYGAPNIRTFEDGRRSSQMADYEDLIKTCHVEDTINSTGYNVCEPNDVDQEVKHYEMVSRSLKLSDMPTMGSVYGADRAQASLDMASIAVDDADLSKPYIVGLINTVPPRSIDTKMLGGLLTYAENGQPTLVSSFTMAGASAPATMAGAFAMATAENLTGLTLTQLVNEGAPAVFGVPASNIDVRYGALSIGSPESALFVSFAGQMGRYYDVPSRGGGALSDTKSIDYQGGFESMLIQVATQFADIDYVLHSAGILESYSTMSPEKLVLDAEIMRFLDRYKDGFDIDDETLAMDVIPEVEAAGHFLSERHTLTHSKDELYKSDVVDKRSHGDWEDDGSKSAFEMGYDRFQQDLEEYEQPELDPDIEQTLDNYVEDGKKTAY